MTTFNSLYGRHNKSTSCPGSPIQVEYSLRYAPDGSQELAVVGETDLDAFIQSHRDSVDFDLIIKRYSLGEVDSLNRVQSFFADVSEFPVNFAEVLNLNDRASSLFDSLPPDVKSYFDNDYVKFLCSENAAIIDAFSRLSGSDSVCDPVDSSVLNNPLEADHVES